MIGRQVVDAPAAAAAAAAEVYEGALVDEEGAAQALHRHVIRTSPGARVVVTSPICESSHERRITPAGDPSPPPIGDPNHTEPACIQHPASSMSRVSIFFQIKVLRDIHAYIHTYVHA